MPPDYQQEVKTFIEFVWEKKLGQEPTYREKETIGLLKGKTWTTPDFNEPCEDFNEDKL